MCTPLALLNESLESAWGASVTAIHSKSPAGPHSWVCAAPDAQPLESPLALAEKQTLALASPLLSLALSKGHSGNLGPLLHPPSHSAFVSIFCVFPGGEVNPLCKCFICPVLHFPSLCVPFFFFKVTFLVTIFKVCWIYRIASALWFSFLACGISAPWPGIEPTCHALEGKALTTGPPGKSPLSFSWDNHSQSAASSSLGHSRESCRVCAEPHPQVGFDWSRGPHSQHMVHWTSVPVEY